MTEHPTTDYARYKALPADERDRLGFAKWQESQASNCWCESCDLIANGPLRTRMSLCPICGDKRCPHAKQHDADCQQEHRRTTP